MVRVLLICFGFLLFWQPVGGATAPSASLFEPFRPAVLDPSEIRLLQSALAAAGVYQGAVDGLWTAEAADGLARIAGRETPGGALDFDAAALVASFLDEVAARGWEMRSLPELGLSLALPYAELGPVEEEEGDQRRWSSDGRFTLLTRRGDRYAAEAWHRATVAANAEAAALVTLREPDRLVTRGVLRDGRLFHARSDRTEGGWSTIYLAAAPEEAGTLALAAGSIAPGQPLPWNLPAGGALTALVAEARAFLAVDAGMDTGRDAGTAPLRATPAILPPAEQPLADEPTTTGTAFYLGARTLVTAGHVVAACDRVSLADGTELSVVATDSALDVAALAAPWPAPRWLTLAAGTPARLGERVHAAGFPYYAIAGTSLHLTGGNVSALAGIDDDTRFFSFTAPVQPGNSGGPLIDGEGGVLGLVVARLSEDFIVEETGSFPQNVNYALSENELAAFLADAGLSIDTASGALGRFDMDAGVPDGFASAVVPVVCH